MIMHHSGRRNRQTGYIRLDPHSCRACWQCLEVCPAGVFDQINLPFHKHIRISRPDQCLGCLKCVKICPQQALQPLRT